MLVLLIIAAALSMAPSTSLLKNTSALSETYQQKCLNILSTQSQTKSSIESLLCGEKITDLRLKENLSKTSLIHIFVVSGSHLLLLDQVLSILRIPLFLRFLSLGFYSLSVGWQPPAARALGALIIRAGFRHYRFYFPGDLLVLVCGLLALVLFPAWWTSMSFQMSWCASLALTLPSIFGIRSRTWKAALASQVFIFCVMMPVLWGWGSLHPLGLICNLILAPVVALVLLPAALLATLHPWLMIAFAKLLSIFEVLINAAAEPVSLPELQAISGGPLWIWIFSLHTLLHFLRLHLKQGRDNS